jgi:hypothetical protein
MDTPKTGMNIEQLLKFHLAFSYQAYRIMEIKNHDYAGAAGESPFRNFTSPEALGIASTEQGILIRMVDKINRLVTFCKDGKLEVTNETAADALLDIINYAVILGAYMRERAGIDNHSLEEAPDGEQSENRNNPE